MNHNTHLLEALRFLHGEEEPITVRQLELLKEGISYDIHAEGIVAGVWTGFLAAKGLIAEVNIEDISVAQQIDLLIEHLNESEGE